MISISFKPRASGKTTELIEISKTLSKQNTILFCGYPANYAMKYFSDISAIQVLVSFMGTKYLHLYTNGKIPTTFLLDEVIPSVDFVQYCEDNNINLYCRATPNGSNDNIELLLKYLREHYPEEILLYSIYQ